MNKQVHAVLNILPAIRCILCSFCFYKMVKYVKMRTDKKGKVRYNRDSDKGEKGCGDMIRDARSEDLQELLDIYNYEVLNGNATFDELPKTYEQRMEWMSHFTGKYPLLVEEIDGRIAGYAGAYKLFPKPAYDISAEVTLYIHQDFRGQGIGERLLRALLERVKKDEQLFSLFSLITGTNKASIRLHEKLGFEYGGVLKNSGVKFGELLDVVIYRYGFTKA